MAPVTHRRIVSESWRLQRAKYAGQQVELPVLLFHLVPNTYVQLQTYVNGSDSAFPAQVTPVVEF